MKSARRKLGAVVRYGFGGLVLLALGISLFASHKQVNLLSAEVIQLKTTLQQHPDVSLLKTQLVAVQKQLESLQLRQKGMAEKAEINVLQQQSSQLERQLLEQTATIAEQGLELTAIRNQIQAITQSQASAPAAVAAPKPSSVTVKKKARVKTTHVVMAPFILTGIEWRGGIAFAAIAPQSATQLTEIALMEPGETRQGWTLMKITGQQAQFRVAGQTRTLTVR